MILFLWLLPAVFALAAGPLEQLGFGLFQDPLLPAEQAFRFQARVHGPQTLNLSWQIADGYYLYRQQFRIRSLTPAVSLGPLQLPPGKPKTDPEFGTTEVYYHQVEASVTVAKRPREATSLALEVRYQGCAERGVCYPPITRTVTLALPPLPTDLSEQERPAPLAEQDRIARAIRDQSFWLTLASFLGFGILLAFTPCCFPTLPILSGIIVGHGSRITTARAFFLSLSYVLASALTYTVFGVLAGLFGANLQAAFQNPWVIAAFAALFVALALSMFGFYELQMPASWQTRLSRWQHKGGGGLVNVAVLGVLSALIVGPCVAAPLAGALIYIGQTGDAVLGGAALFSMGLGMGLPLIAVGTSAGRLLPKAGLWMNTVKAVFGVLLLGVAIWMLERIAPPALTLLLWALWLIVPAIYLGAATPLPEDAPHGRRLGKALGVVMLTYGILLLIGLAAGSRDVLQPLKVLAARPLPRIAAPAFQTVASVSELERTLAQNRGRWAMLDFYADWCISCKELEHRTFTDPEVSTTLAGLLTLKADVTANDENHRQLLQRFGLIGPPALLFFDPQGRECRAARLVGYVPPQRFVAHLQALERHC